MQSPASQEARALLLGCYDGVLSTLSVAVPGYPFGSVVPFCLDRQGVPVILIADIAQHTRNIRGDPKVSLIVFDRTASDLQANGRLTLLADAEIVTQDEDTSERYYRYFPESRDYHLTHGFQFWRLVPKRIRFIGGFGAIHWLEPGDVITPNPFGPDTERGMVEHMDADHVDAMRRYCEGLVDADLATCVPRFAGCDGEGFHLRVADRIVRIRFDSPVSTPQQVRSALVALARRG
ncbi:MAG: HugZ family protein [Gammaproteobacteria bacterium]